MTTIKVSEPLKMFERLLWHTNTCEELQYLWDIALDILSFDDRRGFLICVLTKCQYLLPTERA